MKPPEDFLRQPVPLNHIALYLRDIYFNNRDGRLIFRKDMIYKFLFFKKGYLVFAKTNQPDELLGKVLFRLGKISEKDFQRMDEFITPKKFIGEILVQKGFITPEDLEIGLRYQMREITLNLFPHFNGEFKFQEKTESGLEEFEIKLEVPVLIEDGIRRMKFNPVLREFLIKKTFIPVSKDFYLRLTEEEKEILRTIDGQTDCETILNSYSGHSDLFWKHLYLLYCLKLIDFKEEPREEKEKMETEENEKEQEKQTVEMEEINQLYSRLKELDYYQILNVSRSAEENEIKKSYFRLARQFHPDLFSRDLPAETKEKILDIFNTITQAYRILSNSSARKDYDRKIQSQGKMDGKESANSAEVKFRQARTLYNQARYEEAYVLLREATRVIKNKGQYFLLQALTLSKIPGYLKQAEESFLKAIKLEPWNPEAYAGLGLLYKKEGLKIKAKKQFEKAISLDPDHKVAKKELGDLQKKEGKKLKDFLSLDIFGWKKKEKK